MSNRFRNPQMRHCYETAMTLAADPASEFYHNGEPRRGASHRCAFWDGYNGREETGINRTAHAAPGTLTWAFYRAGQDFRKQQENMSIHLDKSYLKARHRGAWAGLNRETWKTLTGMTKRELAEIAIRLGASCRGECDNPVAGLERVIEERDALREANIT